MIALFKALLLSYFHCLKWLLRLHRFLLTSLTLRKLQLGKINLLSCQIDIFGGQIPNIQDISAELFNSKLVFLWTLKTAVLPMKATRTWTSGNYCKYENAWNPCGNNCKTFNPCYLWEHIFLFAWLSVGEDDRLACWAVKHRAVSLFAHRRPPLEDADSWAKTTEQKSSSSPRCAVVGAQRMCGNCKKSSSNCSFRKYNVVVNTLLLNLRSRCLMWSDAYSRSQGRPFKHWTEAVS